VPVFLYHLGHVVYGFGYLRTVVTTEQLRVEYHPAPDGAAAKTADDTLTVDLLSRALVHFKAVKAASS